MYSWLTQILFAICYVSHGAIIGIFRTGKRQQSSKLDIFIFLWVFRWKPWSFPPALLLRLLCLGCHWLCSGRDTGEGKMWQAGFSLEKFVMIWQPNLRKERKNFLEMRRGWSNSWSPWLSLTFKQDLQFFAQSSGCLKVLSQAFPPQFPVGT